MERGLAPKHGKMEGHAKQMSLQEHYATTPLSGQNNS